MKYLATFLVLILMATSASASIKQKRDSKADWTSNNPTLAAGEIGIEEDTNQQKVGNGSTGWNGLPYSSQSPIIFNSYATDTTLTAAAHNGSLVQMTVAGEVTLWDCEAANVGQYVMVWARDAEKIELVPASGDQFFLFDGTGIGANDELDVPATKGTKVTLMCTADDTWSVVNETATTTDGGAAD